MIVSFLLLSGFVGFWLVQRYQQEKLALNKQLEFNMDETQREVMDTLIFKTIIQPMMGDSILAQLKGLNRVEQVEALNKGVKPFNELEQVKKMKGVSNLKFSVKINSESSMV